MGLLAAVALMPAFASEPSEQERLVWLNYQLAVAEAPGDAYSDQRMARALTLVHGYRAQPDGDAAPVSEPMRAYLARAQVVAAELKAKVDAVRDSDPFLLAADLGCWPKADDMSSCDRRRAKLEAFVPDNAHHGVTLMAYAWLRDDAEAFFRVARLAASAENYDSQPGIAFPSLVQRYRQVPPPAMPGADALTRSHPAEVMAMAMAMATSLPPYQHFINPCRESEGELRAHCLAIARKMMAQSEQLIELSIAASLVEAIGSPEDVALAKSRRREMEWLQAKAVPLLGGIENEAVAGFDEYLAAFSSHGELTAMRALLDLHGVSRLPPPEPSSAAAESGAPL